MISMIAAIGKNNEIGKNNKLIWRIPRDARYFKETTMNHTVLMGRKTYESLPGDLPGRKMVVLSNTLNDDNVSVASNIRELICRYYDCEEEVFVIGGATLYKEFLEYAKKMYLTQIDATDDKADTFFPQFDVSMWDVDTVLTGKYKGIGYEINTYKRKIRKP